MDCRGPDRGRAAGFPSCPRAGLWQRRWRGCGRFGASAEVQLGTCAGQGTQSRLRWWRVSTTVFFTPCTALGPLPLWIQILFLRNPGVWTISKGPLGVTLLVPIWTPPPPRPSQFPGPPHPPHFSFVRKEAVSTSQYLYWCGRRPGSGCEPKSRVTVGWCSRLTLICPGPGCLSQADSRDHACVPIPVHAYMEALCAP